VNLPASLQNAPNLTEGTKSAFPGMVQKLSKLDSTAKEALSKQDFESLKRAYDELYKQYLEAMQAMKVMMEMAAGQFDTKKESATPEALDIVGKIAMRSIDFAEACVMQGKSTGAKK